MNSDRILREARKHKKRREYAKGIGVLKPSFDEAVREKSIDPDILRALAEFYHLAGQTNEGHEAYKTAISDNPGNTLILGRYAEFLALTGQIDKALSFLDKAIKLRPEDNNLILSTGIVLHRYAKNPDAAAVFIQNATSGSQMIDPDISNELEAVLHTIEKRPEPEDRGETIWDRLPTIAAISKQHAISAGSKGGVIKHDRERS